MNRHTKVFERLGNSRENKEGDTLIERFILGLVRNLRLRIFLEIHKDDQT